MGRRNRNRPKPNPPQARSQPEAVQKKEPFYKNPLVVAVGSAVAVAFTFLINAPTFFQNLRSLPAEVATTKSEILSWAKEDAEWTGHWSSFPEGIVDREDMELFDVDLQITIWAKEGQIDGTVATKEICKAMPLWNYFLLRGEVDGKGADVVVWDVIQGHKRDFAKLRLEREGDVLSVRPIEGAIEWFPKVAYIGRQPLPPGHEPSPDQEFCKEQM